MTNKMHKSFTIRLFATFLLLLASSFLWNNVTSMDAPLLVEQRQAEEQRLIQQQQQESKTAASSSHDALPQAPSAVPEHSVIDPGRIVSLPEKNTRFNEATQDLQTGEQIGQVRDRPGSVSRKPNSEEPQQDRPASETDFEGAVQEHLPDCEFYIFLYAKAYIFLTCRGISFDNTVTDSLYARIS